MAKAWARQVVLGMSRLAAPTAQTNWSTDNCSSAPAMDGPITLRTFLSVIKGNKDSPDLIIPRRVQALTKRIFSEKGRRRNLFNRVIPQFALKPLHDLNWPHTVRVRHHTPPSVASPGHFVRIIHNLASQCKYYMRILQLPALLFLPPTS